MNLFWLHPDPETCAKHHVDKHVNKMLTESVQILCTSASMNGYNKFWMYERYMPNHPVVKWAGESYANWNHVWKVAEALYDEYRFRYGQNSVHSAGEMLGKFDLDTIKRGFTLKDQMTRPYQATKDWPDLDESYTKENGIDGDEWAQGFEWPEVVEAYRYYYVGDKSHIAKWKIRGKPEWWDVYERTYDEFMRVYGNESEADKQEA